MTQETTMLQRFTFTLTGWDYEALKELTKPGRFKNKAQAVRWALCLARHVWLHDVPGRLEVEIHEGADKPFTIVTMNTTDNHP